MKRRKFAKRTVLATLSAAAITSLTEAAQDRPSKEFYELRVYTKRFGNAGLDAFLEKALIPALNRQGIARVGVFNQLHSDQPAELYLLIPYASMERFGDVNGKLMSDPTFKSASEEYDKKLPDKPAFGSYKSSFLEAFDGLPKMRSTNTSADRLFELRTYMGHNEDAVSRKVDMFNQEKLPLFDKLELNPVFFARARIGQNLPNLTYMLVFDDIDQRDKNWAIFVDHPEWLKMRGDPRYANTVSNIIRTFLVPAAYSQI